MNKITLGGHLSNDPKLQERQGGHKYCIVTLINNGYKEGQTNFIPVFLNGSTAEFVAKHFKKGSGMIVNGQFIVQRYGENNEKIIHKIEPDNYTGIEFADGKLQINTGCWTGHLTRDPELRYTQSSNPLSVANFTVAVPILRFVSENNVSKVDKDAVTFINVTAYGKTADFIEKYLRKGSKVCVTGRLEYRSWEDEKKETRSTVSVVADSVTSISKKDNEMSGSAPAPAPSPSSSNGDAFSPTSYVGGFNPSNFDEDDDLPF